MQWKTVGTSIVELELEALSQPRGSCFIDSHVLVAILREQRVPRLKLPSTSKSKPYVHVRLSNRYVGLHRVIWAINSSPSLDWDSPWDDSVLLSSTKALPMIFPLDGSLLNLTIANLSEVGSRGLVRASDGVGAAIELVERSRSGSPEFSPSSASIAPPSLYSEEEKTQAPAQFDWIDDQESS